MKVYLAGPIFGQDDDECIQWRSYIKEAVNECTYLDPMDRDYRGKESVDPQKIVIQDKLDIMQCDCLLANTTIPSVGTSMEIMFAAQQGKHVICFKENWAEWSPWILSHTSDVCRGLEAVVVHCLRPWVKRMQETQRVFAKK